MQSQSNAKSIFVTWLKIILQMSLCDVIVEENSYYRHDENSGIFNDFIMLMIASSVKTVVNFLKIIIKLLIMVVSKLNNQISSMGEKAAKIIMTEKPKYDRSFITNYHTSLQKSYKVINQVIVRSFTISHLCCKSPWNHINEKFQL